MPIEIEKKQGRDIKVHQVYTVGELNDLFSKQNRLNERARDIGGGGPSGGPGDASDSDLQDLQDQIDELNNVTIPALESDLDELNNVTIPDLQSQLNDKLDDLPGEITETLIADNAVTTPKLVANAVTANEIAAGTITAFEIAAGTITSNEIAADTIIANNIAAGTITALEIAADTITANELNIAELNAITANTGNLTVTGNIQNSNTDYILNQNGLAIKSTGFFTKERSIEFIDQVSSNGLSNIWHSDTIGLMLTSETNQHIRFVAGGGKDDIARGKNRIELVGVTRFFPHSETIDTNGLIQMAGTGAEVASYITVSPNSGTSDDLNGIRVNFASGQYAGSVIYFIASSGDTITIKDGVDNIITNGGDVTLTDSRIIPFMANAFNDWIMLGGLSV